MISKKTAGLWKQELKQSTLYLFYVAIDPEQIDLKNQDFPVAKTSSLKLTVIK